ncbi:MAG: hypothetical protein PUA93_06085 [Eubacteriales bacterium]|nr:hypothetical protein [Eubacteriales bacterium]
MNGTIQVKKGNSLLFLLKEEDRKKYICAKVDGRLKELSFTFDSDTEIHSLSFLTLEDPDAARIYSTSLTYLIAMAFHELYPKAQLRFFYNISRSMFAKVVDNRSFRMKPETVSALGKRMQELVKEDIPFERVRVSKEEALAKYREMNEPDKAKVLRYRNENYVHLYSCKDEKGTYYDYLYGYLVPSTGYLKDFVLRYYAPGFLIQVPRAECEGKIPPFEDETKFATSLQSTFLWAEKNRLDTVSNINAFIKNYGAMALINVSEARFNNQLAELGRDIVSCQDPIRLVCIAGPSSSGKTSFANRLMYELMSLGLRPLRLSMDDFYIPRSDLPEGTDIESVDALDLPLFNTTMTKLINGEEAPLPVFDFKTKTRSFLKPISLSEDQIIIIEGIHALNARTTEGIPDYQKYKIYIAPQPQVNIDNHTPISMSDMRLLRRIARDSRTRGSSADETISMWPSVRAGEFKYIYPTQENADFVFDSFFPYELSALRNILLPQLDKIKPEDDNYIFANRLRSMVKYFLPIPLVDIPCNSLIREFVGGSSFKDAR